MLCGWVCENPSSGDGLYMLLAWGVTYTVFTLLGFGVAVFVGDTVISWNRLNRTCEFLKYDMRWLVTGFFCALVNCVLFSFRLETLSYSTPIYVVELLTTSTLVFEILVQSLQANLISARAGFLVAEQHIFINLLVSTLATPLFLPSYFSLSPLWIFRLYQNWSKISEKVLKPSTQFQLLNILIYSYVGVFFVLVHVTVFEISYLPTSSEIDLINSFYIITNAVTSTGYGDISPRKTLGRFFIVFSMFGGILWLSYLQERISPLIERTRAGIKSFSPSPEASYILVSGYLTEELVNEIIQEFFHADRNTRKDLRVELCFLSRSKDEYERHLKLVLGFEGEIAKLRDLQKYLVHSNGILAGQPVLGKCLALQASLTCNEDLKRISAKRAEAIYLISDFEKDEDSKICHSLISLQKRLPSTRVLIFLKNKEPYFGILSSRGVLEQNILAVDEFLDTLAGQSILVPNFSTFILNLLTSVSRDEPSKNQPLWFQEYQQGQEMELYELELSRAYSGCSFLEISFDCLERSKGNVYFIGVVEFAEKRETKIFPGHAYVASENSNGIFLASNVNDVRQRKSQEKSRRKREMTKKTSSPIFFETKKNLNLEKLFDESLKLRLTRLLLARSLAAKGHNPSILGVSRDAIKTRVSLGDLLREDRFFSEKLMFDPRLETRKDKIKRELRKKLLKKPRSETGTEKLENHVIILSNSISNFSDFIRTVKKNSSKKSILILSPEKPEFFEGLHFEGSGLSLSDLERVNFRKAEAVYLAQSDDHVILSWNLLKQQCPEKVHLLARVRNKSSLFCLGYPILTKDDSGDDEIKEGNETCDFWAVANGRAFCQSKILASLVASSFYNPSTTASINSFLQSDRLVLLQVDPNWTEVDFFLYFRHLLLKEYLILGLIRRVEEENFVCEKKSLRGRMRFLRQKSLENTSSATYVLTAPPQRTTLLKRGDKILAIKAN